MDVAMTESAETPLARARRGLAEAERAVRDEQTVLAAFQTKDRHLAQEAQRLQATMRQADDRATIRAAQERQAGVEHERAEVGKDIAAQELIIERRKANVTAATMAIDTIWNQAAALRERISRDQGEARQLEGDIAKAETDLEGWRRGLAVLQKRIEAASSQLQELGTYRSG